MDRFMSDRYPFTALTHQKGRENCFEVNDSHMMSNDLDVSDIIKVIPA